MSEPSLPRVRVKICGLTNPRDARAAVAAGADALGFNLWPGSKRHIVLEENVSWIRELPPFVSRVAVLVDIPIEEAIRIAAHPVIDCVQFHGHESPDYLREFARTGNPFIVAIRLGSLSDLDAAARLPAENFLLDAAVAGALGGTGSTANWEWAAEFVRRFPDSRVILAGGLTPANVADAVRFTRPFGVDVASGVEANPRVKDEIKMKRFVRAALAVGRVDEEFLS
jgi:phosphoribosylanthranilate isomerase